MTDDEHNALVLLAEAWNMFLRLDNHHPSDIPEFQQSLHRLQEKIMARVARRQHPEFFT